MSIEWVLVIIFFVLAVIISNITLLRDSKEFHLPDSYKERKAAEEAYLQSQADNSDASTSDSNSANSSNDTLPKA